MKNFSYRSDATCFITICVQDARPLPGRVHGECVALTEAGRMVQRTVLELAQHIPGFTLIHHAVMPDHVHLVFSLSGCAIAVGEIVKRFKTLTTRRYIDLVRERRAPAFRKRLWQRNYWERVVRSERELEDTWANIQANPSNWRERLRFVEQDTPPDGT